MPWTKCGYQAPPPNQETLDWLAQVDWTKCNDCGEPLQHNSFVLQTPWCHECHLKWVKTKPGGANYCPCCRMPREAPPTTCTCNDCLHAMYARRNQ